MTSSGISQKKIQNEAIYVVISYLWHDYIRKQVAI